MTRHRVTITEAGDDLDKVQALCDPGPYVDSVPFCWTGPSRESIEEAMADGVAHDPEWTPNADQYIEDRAAVEHFKQSVGGRPT